MAERDPLAPATRQDIPNLLRELRQMSAADVDIVRTEVQIVTVCTQATEVEVTDIKQEVQVLKEQMLNMQHSHATLTQQVDISKDRKRRTNIKIRGIPDSDGHA
ncbi:Hypothetical predicted protein [Pelobates cultripes]|uniref:Uncharacterized protein n=1 Tax=Pelobates cultripes TaxID=61616 RepID=A0AAD1W3E2_PELCU|nr:Hypothetical predicted protein [Pelobates cultripes]